MSGAHLPRKLALLAGMLVLAISSWQPRALAQTETERDRIDPRYTGSPRDPSTQPTAKLLSVPDLTSLVCLPLYGSFAAGNWPAGCWRPYSSSSPFNQEIPANPRLDPLSPQIVARVLGFGSIQHLLAGEADTTADYGHPTYYSALTDPLYRLHCYEASWGTCPIEGELINVPEAARPAAGGDGHMTIVNQTSGVEYDLYKVRSKPSGGGTLEFRWGGSTSITGPGTGSAATASQFGNLAGIIRAQELAAGEIRHAIFMVVKCDSGQYVYPAQKAGRRCSDIGLSDTYAPPMGARFQLNMTDAEINALAVPSWKKTILRAMARYGAIMGDTGSGSFAIQAESGSTYTSFGHEDKLVAFARGAGVPLSNGKYVFNLRDGVNWAQRLRVVYPTLETATSPPPGVTIDIPPTLPIVGQPPAGGSPSPTTSPTTGSPRPAPSPPPPAGRSRAPVLRIGSIRTAARGRLVVTLACRGRSACRGRLTLATLPKRRAKAVTLIRKAFTIAANRTLKLRVRLSGRGRAALRRKRRVRAKATVTSGGKRTTKRVTLRGFTR